MEITVLSENTSAVPSLESEHGLSLFITTNERKILFDMGQGNLFSDNAQKLGIDLSKTDMAIVSHGHYDHGGGLRNFLNITNQTSVYININAFGSYFNSQSKYIGLDKELSENKRLIKVKDIHKLSENMTLYTGNTLERKYKTDTAGLTMLKKDEYIPDAFMHEQYLVIEEDNKRILISGCSHKGVLNIMDWFKPDVFIGGFHFSKITDKERLKKYAEELNKYNTDFYTCHCTGFEQYEYMKKYMRNLKYISTGSRFTI